MAENEMDKLTTDMMEHVCDHICKYPDKLASELKLSEKCSDCQMGQFFCDIKNTYNQLNDFDNTQAKLLTELGRFEKVEGYTFHGEQLYAKKGECT